MKRKDLFISGICVAFASLAAVSVIVALGLETKREDFIFWDFIGNLCRGILLTSALWVAAATILRWKALSKRLRLAGLSPMMSILGIIVISLALDHARPDVKLFVSYEGSRDEMPVDVTTHYGSQGLLLKRGEESLVSDGRGFPEVLHLRWGTNYIREFSKEYTQEFSKDFSVKGKIPRFGISETLRVIVSDEGAQLVVGSELDGAANRSQPVRSQTNQTSAAAGSGR
jgi:hypothetical protein